MEWKIFKAYDIRGVYPEEVNEESFYRIAQAYALVFRPRTVAVGMDVRLSSEVLKGAVISGLQDAGVGVVDVGEITTDMMYFAVGNFDYSGGIIVSASHNPREYNGLKMVRENAKGISSDTGLFEIRDALQQDKDKAAGASEKGSFERRDILQDYVDYVLSFVDASAIARFKIIANGNFGFVSRPVKLLAERLDLDLVAINFEPDGSFPKGPPDPMLPENRAETEALASKAGIDFAAAWDADADRVMFFDEKGRFISGAYVTALLARIMLQKYGSENKIIGDPRVVWPVKREVERMGGQLIISKCGHAFFKDIMRSENAIFGGEMSAHYYFRQNFYADNGIIPFLLVLECLSKEGKKLSQVMSPITEGHFMSGELNYKVSDADAVIRRVRDAFREKGREDFIDGYSVASSDWRFNIRPSNTEPLLRLNVEATSEEQVEAVRKRIEGMVV